MFLHMCRDSSYSVHCVTIVEDTNPVRLGSAERLCYFWGRCVIMFICSSSHILSHVSTDGQSSPVIARN